MGDEDAAESGREPRYCEWFARRHLGAGDGSGNIAHLADVVLCALQMGEKRQRQRAGLWAWLWDLAGSQAYEGRPQAFLAFLFAARGTSSYAREALASLLEHEGPQCRRRLADL